MKHLYKSNENKVFSGILGGLGEYYNVDPVVLRVVFVFVMIITGIIPCALFYFICTFIIPKNPNTIIIENKSTFKESELDKEEENI